MADEQPLLELIASSRHGVLAAVTRASYPHLANVLYAWDAEERIARVSTTADRVKARALRREPRAALHVSGPHFWSYAVAECDAELSAVAATPGDPACLELLAMRSDVHRDEEKEAFFSQMIDAGRLVVRLRSEGSTAWCCPTRPAAEGARPRGP